MAHRLWCCSRDLQVQDVVNLLYEQYFCLLKLNKALPCLALMLSATHLRKSHARTIVIFCADEIKWLPSTLLCFEWCNACLVTHNFFCIIFCFKRSSYMYLSSYRFENQNKFYSSNVSIDNPEIYGYLSLVFISENTNTESSPVALQNKKCK